MRLQRFAHSAARRVDLRAVSRERFDYSAAA
jgi:hypothetical protein